MNFIKKYFKLETTSGIILLIAACLAMIAANSPLQYLYAEQFDANVIFWINDGLMVLFFLLISLELKRELKRGELANKKSAVLPAIAAFGGMLIPAIIYTLINFHHPDTLDGWAIPVATDIAFALGVLALVSKNLPHGLRVFLMSLAIFDDLGAILIIAAFHSHNLSWSYIAGCDVIFVLLALLNYFHIKNLFPYLILGIGLWFGILNSGIHPTIAGVLLGFTIPSGTELNAPSRKLELILHPWVAYLILPLFAFANAGVSLTGVSFTTLFSPITLGIILGLFVGKQIGVFSFTWFAIRSKLARKPRDVTWLELYGASLLCGIGFTMSLFLGTLAFNDSDVYMNEVRLGVLLGSLLSGIAGGVVLRHCSKLRALMTGS